MLILWIRKPGGEERLLKVGLEGTGPTKGRIHLGAQVNASPQVGLCPREEGQPTHCQPFATSVKKGAL